MMRQAFFFFASITNVMCRHIRMCVRESARERGDGERDERRPEKKSRYRGSCVSFLGLRSSLDIGFHIK